MMVLLLGGVSEISGTVTCEARRAISESRSQEPDDVQLTRDACKLCDIHVLRRDHFSSMAASHRFNSCILLSYLDTPARARPRDSREPNQHRVTLIQYVNCAIVKCNNITTSMFFAFRNLAF